MDGSGGERILTLKRHVCENVLKLRGKGWKRSIKDIILIHCSTFDTCQSEYSSENARGLEVGKDGHMSRVEWNRTKELRMVLNGTLTDTCSK